MQWQHMAILIQSVSFFLVGSKKLFCVKCSLTDKRELLVHYHNDCIMLLLVLFESLHAQARMAVVLFAYVHCTSNERDLMSLPTQLSHVLLSMTIQNYPIR